MTDLLLTLWLIFGSLYALNISLCLLALHNKAKKVSKSWVIKSVVVNAILVIALFPILMFDLAPAKTKAVKLYKALSKGYEEYQEKEEC